MPRWERHRSLFAAGAAGAAIVAWALAFQTGVESPDWNADWRPSAPLRGTTIAIGSRKVETRAEREQRLASEAKELRQELGDVKRSILGDKRKTLGDDIEPVRPELGRDLDYTPREACLQMKLAYPERYGNIDCMSDKYDSTEVWWK